MEKNANAYIIPNQKESINYSNPKTHYCKTKKEFNEAVGEDFIKQANLVTERGEEFLVGLSHGQSPSGAYEYILSKYSELKHPDKIHYTFVNSKLKRQRGLVEVRDAISFIKELLESKKIKKDQILGRSLDRNNLVEYKNGLNDSLTSYLNTLNKKGLDYVFLASSPTGQVAGITRKSKAFNSTEIVVVVEDTDGQELTFTPSFLKKSARIAFLATKAEKRRPLAWLFYRWPKENESPGFLRFVDDIENKMVVFIDDHALTWPQVTLKRDTGYGETSIRIDMALPFNEKQSGKRPVILMIHGFLGLNTFDALLAFVSSHKYISAAMHYGSVPDDLPLNEYSQFVVNNINHVVAYFGELGHPVYILDHSMANTYMLMVDEQIDDLHGINKYVKGRIASNPFFGQEAKHASLKFMDNVILQSNISMIDRVVFKTARALLPLESKNGIRNIAIKLSNWLIRKDSVIHDRIWRAIKQRIMVLVSDMDMLPELNKVPLEHTLSRLPIKIFAIQIQSALRESKKLDRITHLKGYGKYNIPTLILKSERDPIAKFVSSVYNTSYDITILDITNHDEKDIFREHLFYMIHPYSTINIIDHFIKETEAKQSSKKLEEANL